jgi:radical SAM protein with 4Fe4S-binding SPASM domain
MYSEKYFVLLSAELKFKEPFCWTSHIDKYRKEVQIMTLFERITVSAEALAEYLAKPENKISEDCKFCAYRDECNGHEDCKKFWLNALNSESEEEK